MNGGYQNNGSLEDCYSNIFTLTEVNGLKWKCYRTPPNAPRGIPLTCDPILRAYSKCVQEGILCAWRRKPLNVATNNDALPLPQFSHDMSKELWLFWYNDKPPSTDEICSELAVDEDEMSNGASSNTVSYEVRVLLFKALHVIIERSLMKSGYVRFGRWFTRPLQAKSKDMHYMNPTYTIAVRFHFFIHGGNTVCVAINTQRQPTLIQLHRRHLDYDSLKRRITVIVGPWSMRGYLVRNQLSLLSEPKMTLNAERQWNEWKEFVELDMEDEPAKTGETADKTAQPDAESTEKDKEKDKKNEETDKDSKETEADIEKEKEKEAEEPPVTATTTAAATAVTKKIEAADDTTADGVKVPMQEITSGVVEEESEDSDEESVPKEKEKEKEKEPPVTTNVPKMVLVEIDGVRMLFPARYVCVTLEDDRLAWDALGHNVSTVPSELVVLGPKPRNKFVVESAHAMIPLQGAIQSTLLAPHKIVQRQAPAPRGGFAQPIPPVDEKQCRWEFLSPYKLSCSCSAYSSSSRSICEACLFVDRRLQQADPLVLTNEEQTRVRQPTFAQLDMDYDRSTYHRARDPKTAQIIKMKELERQRHESGGVAAAGDHPAAGPLKELSPPKDDSSDRSTPPDDEDEEEEEARKGKASDKDGGESKEKDTEKKKKETKDGDDDTQDESESSDWCNSDIDELVTDTKFPNEDHLPPSSASSSSSTSSDEESCSFTPFTPVSALSPCNECNWPAFPADKLSESVFNSIFRQNVESSVPATATREEKVDEWDCYYNPTLPKLRQAPEYAEYHRKARTVKSKPKPYPPEILPVLSFMGDEQASATTTSTPTSPSAGSSENKTLPKLGAGGKEEHSEKKTRCSQEKTERKAMLKILAIKDEVATNKKRSPRKNLRKSVGEISDPSLNGKSPSEPLDMRNVIEMLGEETREKDMANSIAGYVDPYYRCSPVPSEFGDVPETLSDVLDDKENRFVRGMFEGTSLQYVTSEPMEIDVNNLPSVSCDVPTTSCNSVNGNCHMASGEADAGQHDDHGSTDGLLSPPASNEMPRGGPLSVGSEWPRGPPSIEGQAMNQIYPTPPSVQMTEQQQFSPAMVPVPLAMSKQMGCKKDSMPTIQEEMEVYSIAIGINSNLDEATLEDEVENLSNWTRQSDVFGKLTNLLGGMHITPLSVEERKTRMPLSNQFSKESTKRHPFSDTEVYPKMTDSAFENPPLYSYGKLIEIVPPAPQPPQPPIGLPQPTSAFPALNSGTMGNPPTNTAPGVMPPTSLPQLPQPGFDNQQHHHQPFHHLSSQFPGGGPMHPHAPFGGAPNPNLGMNQGGMNQMNNTGYMGFGGHMPPSNFPGPGHPMGGFPPDQSMYGGMGQRRGPQFPGGPGGPGAMNLNQPGMQGMYGGPGGPMQMRNPMMGGMGQRAMGAPPMGGPMHMGHGGFPPGPQGLNNMVSPQFGGMSGPGAGMPNSVQQLNSFVNQQRFGGPGGPGPGAGGVLNAMGGAGGSGQMTPTMPGYGGFFAGGMGGHMGPQGNTFNPMHPMMRPMQNDPVDQGQGMGMPGQQQHQQHMGMGMMQNMGSQMGQNPSGDMMMQQHMQQQGQQVVPASSSSMALASVAKEPQVPEGESVVIAIILSDTILDLHFDTTFDSCPICSCNVSIRARELGLYITPHDILRSSIHQRDQVIGPWSGFHTNSTGNCTCGFSAIRHRYLSYCSGLFPEDSSESTALENSVANVVPHMDLTHTGMELSKNIVWFEGGSSSDLALLDQIRSLAQTHSFGKAMAQMASLAELADRAAKAMDIGMDVSSASEYVISQVDSMELLMLGNSAIDMSMRSMSVNRSAVISSHKFLTYFHPWGLQTANEIRDPSTVEWQSILHCVAPALEDSIRIARSLSATTGSIIEGPLTWRNFVAKSSKTKTQANPEQLEDELSSVEAMPSVMIATATESVKASPLIRTIWNHAQLTPVDQPKDVMYIAVIPDDDVVYDKMVKFMELVSKQYEKSRFGRHIPFPVSTPTSPPTINSRKRHLSSTNRTMTTTAVTSMNIPPQVPSSSHSGMGQMSQLVDATQASQAEISISLAGSTSSMDTSSDGMFGDDALKLNEDKEMTDRAVLDTLGSKAKKARPPLLPTKLEELIRACAESTDMKETPREGILRVGGVRRSATRTISATASSSLEFSNLSRHLNDNTGFVTRLKLYTQQMEEQVVSALTENPNAFDRFGFRYQSAVEARVKRDREVAHLSTVRESTSPTSAAGVAAASCSSLVRSDDDSEAPTAATSTASDGTATTPGASDGRAGGSNGDANASPSVVSNVPSPVPAGMVHIPETQSDRGTQPTLHELLAEPSSLMPGSANIQWSQRDTSVPNPFRTSTQAPVDYEDIGGKEKDDVSTLPHVIVVYITNPFTWGTENHSIVHMRVAMLSFIRTFNSILLKLPFKKRPQLQLEIIGLEQIDDTIQSVPDYLNDPKQPMDLFAKSSNSNILQLEDRERLAAGNLAETAKSLTLAVYTHPRVFFPDCYRLIQPRCMTAFGPGSQLLKTVEEMERINDDYAQRMAMGNMMSNSLRLSPPGAASNKSLYAFKVASNVMCLAPPPAVLETTPDGKVSAVSNDESVLYISYCLVGADFLVAALTDAQGKLIDNCVINMRPRHEANQTFRYKQRTQILDAIGRLWSFILGAMASDVKNWRLVVGRLGRIGHGEFRAWAHLLNKTSLLKYSTRLKDICSACNKMPGVVGTPAILSACLVTIEPEPNIRLFPDYFDTENLTKKGRQLMTPDELSCTHIITFPVGADINYESQDQSSDTKIEDNWDFGDLDMMEGLEDDEMKGIMNEVGETETPLSGAIRSGGASAFFADETANVDYQNQPLACGYYISTSPAPELPDWFWASCPSAKRNLPVHLKSSLHINITDIKNDDLAIESKDKDKEKEKDIHPLESHQTEEVLRHVLETYNALSWLNVDATTAQRYSCLPIHIQHLLRLYHSIVRLIL